MDEVICGRIVTPGGVVTGRVVVSGGFVAEVGADRRASADAGWVVPGFVDGHVHGGGGGQFNTDSIDEVHEVVRFHATHGTTALLATTVSAPVAELQRSLVAIGRARAASAAPGSLARDAGGPGARILGAHLEGPFISPRRPGAMDPETFLGCDASVAERLLACGAPVGMVTLAPELPGALELVDVLVGRGIVVSLGHSDASYEQARAAARAGARSVTHLFNAMTPLHHRSPGLVGAALDLEELGGELICDGLHVAPSALRLAWRASRGAGVRLVTDAMQAAGMPDGEYRLGAGRVRVSGGRAVTDTAHGESLAGSTLTMDAAVRNAVELMGLSVPSAVALASTVPASLLGMSDRLGALVAGLAADLVVLDDELRVRRTMVGGRWVFSAS